MDTNFCFPIQIQLRNNRWMACSVILLYSISMIVMAFILKGITLIGALLALIIALMITLKNHQQEFQWTVLYGTTPENWSLINKKGIYQTVKVTGLTLIGSLCILRITINGYSTSMYATQRYQLKNQWHKLRVHKQWSAI